MPPFVLILVDPMNAVHQSEYYQHSFDTTYEVKVARGDQLYNISSLRYLQNRKVDHFIRLSNGINANEYVSSSNLL